MTSRDHETTLAPAFPDDAWVIAPEQLWWRPNPTRYECSCPRCHAQGAGRVFSTDCPLCDVGYLEP